MLTLGVPGSGTTAVLLVALAALNVPAGPLLFTQHPDIVWSLVAALYIGNIMLLVLNLPLISIFVRILYTPMYLLFPLIMVISVIGVFNANQATLDLVLLCAFGVLGYYMRRNGYPIAPIILGYVLGYRMEEALRQSMIMTQGNLLVLLERPIVSTFLILAVISMTVPIVLQQIRLRGRRIELEGEQG
jgi:putative tricarboxylic transport membrane protein